MTIGDTAARDTVTGPKWDRHYAEENYIFGTAPNVFLASEAHRFKPHGRILVPGDGEGRNGVWLSGQGFAVTSVEASSVCVGKARALALGQVHVRRERLAAHLIEAINQAVAA